MEVHEVYEYRVTQYDQQTGNGGLFAQYIDTFLNSRPKLEDTPIGCGVPRMRTDTLATLIRTKASNKIRTR